MELKDILGTEDKEEQVKIVSNLVGASNADPIVVTAYLNRVTGKVTLLKGGEYSFDDIYVILETVRKFVVSEERESLKPKDIAVKETAKKNSKE
jgi:hypothetical protein